MIPRSQKVSWVVLVIRSPPANAGDLETRVQSLGQQDPPEEGMAIYSSILAWRIPWTEELGGLQSIGLQRVRHEWSDLACMHARTHARSQSWWWRISELHSILSGPQPRDLPPHSLCPRLSLIQRAHALWAFIVSPVSLMSSHRALLLFGNTFFSVSEKRKPRLK